MSFTLLDYTTLPIPRNIETTAKPNLSSWSDQTTIIRLLLFSNMSIYSLKKIYFPPIVYNWPRFPLWDECKCGIADKVGTMCHVKYGIMCSLDISRHSRVDYIQYQNYSWITITQILHSDILAWQKNVITVPNSVQNYCKTSQQPAAVLSLMTMTKTVNDISLLEPSTWTTWRCLIQPFMC